MRIITYILILLIVILGITFALLNHSPVTFNYYLGQQTLPLSMLLIISFALGTLLGLLVSLWVYIKLKIIHFRLNKHLKVAEKEIENLRAIPLQDRH
jgi:lipopolysaccharide assembly protein A